MQHRKGFVKLIQMLFPVALFAPLCVANAASPGNAPPLPVTGTRIVSVATEPQLQTAMGNLQNGDTLLLADGTYNLTGSLYIMAGTTSPFAATPAAPTSSSPARAWTIPTTAASRSASGATAPTRPSPTSRSATLGTTKLFSTRARSRRASIASGC